MTVSYSVGIKAPSCRSAASMVGAFEPIDEQLLYIGANRPPMRSTLIGRDSVGQIAVCFRRFSTTAARVGDARGF